MAVTAQMVKELRESTGAGMMDAKKALTETNGDMEAAVDWLRTKGLAKAAKKADRVAAEGLVGVQVSNGRGVAIEINSETDFVAKNADFQQLVREISEVALETATDDDGIPQPWAGETRIFIYPGYRFRCVDALITTFPLPESTLLMLVAAFAGQAGILYAYRHAVEQRYRFFSYGDAMFITRRLMV